jgi:hypothetical protein
MGSRSSKKWKPQLKKPRGVLEVFKKKREIARVRNPEIQATPNLDHNQLQVEILRDLARLQKITLDLKFYLSQLVDK